MASQIKKSPIDWDVFRTGAPVAAESATSRSVTGSSSSTAKRSIDLSVQEKPVVIKPQKKVKQDKLTDGRETGEESANFRVVRLDGDVSALETYVVDFDINAYGRAIYEQSKPGALRPVVRLTVGTITIVAAVAGQKVINAIVRRRMAAGAATATAIQATQVVGQASAAAGKTKRFAWLSGKLRAATSAARTLAARAAGAPKNAALFAFNAGTSIFAMCVATKDLSQWMADALGDFIKARSSEWVPDQTFTREGDFARLNAILTAGSLARAGKRGGAAFAVSGRDIKLLAILCSTDVMIEPLDIVTSATVADALQSIIKSVTEQEEGRNVTDEEHSRILTETLDKTRMTLYIADPDDPAPTTEKLKNLQAEVKGLLLKFSRSIHDIREWDLEDIFVPLVIIAERLTRLPTMMTKIAARLTALGECTFATTFDEDTQAMLMAIDNQNVKDGGDGWFDYIKNFILYHAGFEVPGVKSNPDTQGNEIIPVGGI